MRFSFETKALEIKSHDIWRKREGNKKEIFIFWGGLVWSSWFFLSIFFNVIKVRFEMKSTTQWVGYFETISGHFFGNYINISHKTEVLIVVLMCLTYWNPYLIKNYNIKHNFCHFCFFQFCKKKSQLTNGYFMTISGHFLPTT